MFAVSKNLIPRSNALRMAATDSLSSTSPQPSGWLPNQNGPPIAQQPIPIAGISCSPSLRVRGVLIGILSPDDRRSSSLVVGTPEKPPRAGSGEPGTGAIAIQER